MSKTFTITILIIVLLVNSLKAQYTQYFDEDSVPDEITLADTNNVSNLRIEDGHLVFDVIAGNWENVGPLINVNMPVEEARGEMLRFDVYSHTGSNFVAGVRVTFIVDGNKVAYNQNNAGMQGFWSRDISPSGMKIECNLDSIIRGYELQFNDGNTFNGIIDYVLIEFGRGDFVIGKSIGIDNIEIGVAKVETLGVSDTRIVKGEELKLISSENGEFYFTGWSKPEIDLDELNRIAETKQGMKKESEAGETVSFNTENLHPGVYNVSIVSSDIVLETKEIVIAYPDNYQFDLEDPNLYGVKNIWNASRDAKEYNKHYLVVAVAGNDWWDKIQPTEGQFDWSTLDDILADAAYTQKPVVYKINTPAPEWIFNYVAHVGGLTEAGGITRGGGKAPQFWSPVYKKFYKTLIDSLAQHVANSPNRKWFLGVRIQPNAFNTEAWHYNFNGKEMELAGITADRSTWIPPRNGDEIYPTLLEANNFAEGKQYFEDVIDYFQSAFHPLGFYTFLRPYLEVDAILNLDCSPYFENEFTVAMGTDATAGRNKPTTNRGQVFKKYARDLKKGAFHEDTWASFRAEEWNAAHGREPNYSLVPRSAEMAIYWRQFLKLYEGVTMSAFGSVELFLLDNPAYQAAVDIFSKYAGGEMDVTQTQYAWMVFAEYTDWNLNPQLRNVGYWLSEDNTSKTAISADTTEGADYRAFHLASLTGEETSLTVAPEFVQSHTGRAVVSIEWRGEPGNAWELYSDGVKMGNAESTSESFVTNTFEHTSVPEKLIIRKISGNPKFHLVEVFKLAADTSQTVSTSGISIDACPLVNLIIGENYQFQAIVLPLDAADKSVTWTSSDPDVLTVDESGFAIAVSEGIASITVISNDGGYTAKCEVMVAKAYTSVTGVSLSDCPTELLEPGNVYQLIAHVIPEDADDKSVSWISSNEEVATVDETGLITLLSAGETIITVTTNDGDFTDECSITVEASTIVRQIDGTGQFVKVFPNPASDVIHLGFSESASEKVISIFNTKGQLLFSKNTYNSNTQIDIRQFHSEGMLIVKVVSGAIAASFKVINK